MPASGGIKHVDANVWLAIAADGHTHHAIATSWFDGQGSSSCALCRVFQMALLRHLTNSKIMGVNVQTQIEAWRSCDELGNDPRVVFLQEPLGLEAAFRRLTQAGSPCHTLWTDAYLAASAVESQAQLVSFDRRFRRFGGLAFLALTDAQVSTGTAGGLESEGMTP